MKPLLEKVLVALLTAGVLALFQMHARLVRLETLQVWHHGDSGPGK